MTPPRQQLRVRLEQISSDPDRALIARSIVSAPDDDALADRVVAATEELSGEACEELLHASFSMGAVFGWRLASGARVALKLHAPGAVRSELEAGYAIMDRLARDAYPCPRLLREPTESHGALCVLTSWLDATESPATSERASAQIRAEALAWLVREASASSHAASLAERDPIESPWPVPHSAVFDFEATRAGAEAIDDLGAWSATELAEGGGPLIVSHGDFCAHNVRLDEDRISAVFDWDSLRRDRHAVAVGEAALASGFDTRRALSDPPTAAWVETFIAAYEGATRPFSSAEARLARIAALRTFAYMARCQQSYAAVNHRALDEFPFPTHLARFEAELSIGR